MIDALVWSAPAAEIVEEAPGGGHGAGRPLGGADRASGRARGDRADVDKGVAGFFHRRDVRPGIRAELGWYRPARRPGPATPTTMRACRPRRRVGDEPEQAAVLGVHDRVSGEENQPPSVQVLGPAGHGELVCATAPVAELGAAGQPPRPGRARPPSVRSGSAAGHRMSPRGGAGCRYRHLRSPRGGRRGRRGAGASPRCLPAAWPRPRSRPGRRPSPPLHLEGELAEQFRRAEQLGQRRGVLGFERQPGRSRQIWPVPHPAAFAVTPLDPPRRLIAVFLSVAPAGRDQQPPAPGVIAGR